jgi:3-oxoacyl-[acyl-carrier protein] reductase
MAEQKTALVTGASKGIGAAIAKTLARDGFDIWLNYRTNDSSANEVKAEIEKSGRQCRLLKFDVSDFLQTQTALESLLEKQTPYVLVNNAGFRRDTLLAAMKYQEWKDVISVTLDGYFNVTNAVLPYMIHQRQGRIINIASAAAHFGVPGQGNYSAAKAGLLGATRSLAAEVAKRNILVNAISPGYIETDILEGLPLEHIVKAIPLGKIGKPQDVAELAAFLASEKAGYITGQTFQVNGGIGS